MDAGAGACSLGLRRPLGHRGGQTPLGWTDVADLIAAVGPEDSVIINKESKSFNWFRFGNCRLTAFTTLDNRIINVETEGSTEGCEVYIKKMGRG